MTFNLIIINNTLVASLILYVAILLITTVKIKNKKFSQKNLGIFIYLVLLLASLRLGLYFYLTVYLANYYGLINDLLSILLYPEFPFSQEILQQLISPVFNPETPIYYYPMFWVTNIILFTFGSLVWLYPILIFISEKEAVSPNSE